MIKLQIVGNLGKDCIVKEVNGKNVINFSVAHTERYKDSQGNPKERTTWVECAYWSDKTALGQYLKKGQMVYAEGSPEAEAYLNKENQPAATLRMRVQNVQLLGGNNKEGQGTNQGNVSNIGSAPAPAVRTIPQSSNVPVEDDLPF
ncbi:MAG: single-stranded DNA-binding protein [Ferruginibacter sp.]|nr:single-stranded DNA-binding protein [Ferruginibacter sp.]